MEIIKIIPGLYAANSYLVYCEKNKVGILIDPGGDASVILETIKNKEVKIEYIVLTHGHGDHIAGAGEIKNTLDIPILIHEDDEKMIQDPKLNLSNILGMGSISLDADVLLKHGDTIKFGNKKAQVIHTPGHTQGGISLKIDRYLFTGDSLFKGSIGRTDLIGGNYETLINSIKDKLLVLDENLIIYPGHGESSTILEEKTSNPFLV